MELFSLVAVVHAPSHCPRQNIQVAAVQMGAKSVDNTNPPAARQ